MDLVRAPLASAASLRFALHYDDKDDKDDMRDDYASLSYKMMT